MSSVLGPQKRSKFLAEDADHAVGDQLALALVRAVEHVEPQWALALGWIEEDQTVLVVLWDALE